MFTGTILVTLAVGIGANTAIFSVLNAVLLKALPFPHPQQLVSVVMSAAGLNIPEVPLGPAYYFVFRDQNRSFQDLGLYHHDSVSVTGLAEPQRVEG
jgi:hypothetical protein